MKSSFSQQNEINDDVLTSFCVLLPNSLYRAACFENFEGVFGFFCSVNYLSGGGVMQITTLLTRLLRDGRGNLSNRTRQ